MTGDEREEALALYLKVIDYQPDHKEALLMAGHISVALQKFDDAEDFYKRVLEIDPQHEDAGLLLLTGRTNSRKLMMPSALITSFDNQ